MKLEELVTFLGSIVTEITNFWHFLITSSGSIIVFTAAAVAVIGYATSGLWRMFSKRKRGGRG